MSIFIILEAYEQNDVQGGVTPASSTPAR